MIRPRPGKVPTYQVVVYIGKDPVSGKQRWIRETVHGNTIEQARKRAEDRERRLTVKVHDGHYKGTTATVGDLLEQWLELAAPRLSPTTVRGYRGKIDVQIVPRIGTVPVTKLSTVMLDKLYRDLAAGDDGLAPATIRQVHAILRRALSLAVRWGWVPYNAAAVPDTAPRVPKRRIVPPSVDETRRLVAGALDLDPDVGVLVALAAATGARRGELCGLRWSHIDLKSAVLKIVDTVVEVGGGEWVVKNTKTEEPRRVSLDRATVALLRAHQKAVKTRALAAGVPLDPDPYVATSAPDGSLPLRPGLVTERFGQVNKRLGLKVRLHDLRHWHATHLLDSGVPLATVSERLGHRDQSTTSNIYSHAVTESDQRAAREIGRVLHDESRPVRRRTPRLA